MGSIDIEIHDRLKALPMQYRKELELVFSGKAYPSLSLVSAVVAKHVFSPDTHPDRLDFLLRRTTGGHVH